MEKIKLNPCECGCGSIAKQGNKYILGHNGILNRGRLCSENKKQKLRLANIGKKHSQESINKRIESRLWYRHSEETRIAIGNGNKGKIRTEEFKETKRKSRVGKSSGMKGKHHTEESKIKMSESSKGKIVSEETRKKMSDRMVGENNPAKRPEIRKKISKMVKEIQQNPEYKAKHSGKNHYNWQGGISFGPYSQDFTSFIKEQVRQRDNHTCQLCGKSQNNCRRKLDIHHINYDKKNSNIDNLISLCQSCHMKTNNISSRELWKDRIWKICHCI